VIERRPLPAPTDAQPAQMTRIVAILCLAAAWLAPSALAADTAVTLTLSKTSAVHGHAVVASGQVRPGVAGEEVAIETGTGDAWTEVARATVDSAGTFEAALKATASGFVRARVLSTGAMSEPRALEVVPNVRARALPGRAFVGAKVKLRVTPASYSGRVSIVVRSGTQVMATASRKVAGGKVTMLVPAPGVGRFVVVMTFPAEGGLSSRVASIRLRSAARTVSYGSSGPDVRGLMRRLADLRFRVPAMSSSFGYELVDSVLAFQKAYGLSRTGFVDTQTWQALTVARELSPRHRGPEAHIEVDKTRQILLDVRDGSVVAVLPVSTGATGNTPEGKHEIRWKAPATTTWLGPAILYRTLTFYGNSFAIHGFPSVPAYPASHGCVRIPIWTADWLYNRSPVGETVYVYA
jgi:hypothetical protein